MPSFSVLRHALRSLTRTPGFAWSITLTLAVGIGLASATGVVARAIAFAGLPVDDPHRVVVLWGVDRAGSFQHMPLGPKNLPDLATAMRGVATIAAGDYNGAYPWPFQVSAGDESLLRLRGTLAGGNYFDVLRVQPVLGRALRPEDDRIGAPRVMVLSHAAWQRQFGGDPGVIGRSLHSVIWNARYTIVGVMPPGLDVPRGVEFWTAFAPTAARNGSLDESWFGVDVIARLLPGATTEQARQVLTVYYNALARGGQAEWAGAHGTVRTLPELVTGDVRPAFAALAAAAAVVFLVTCGNVVGLLLVRANGRRRELAVRAAIGAGRVRLVGELLATHGLLALAGGALGSGVAAGAVRAFASLAPAELPRVADLGVDWALLAAVATVTTFVVLVVGVAPAIAATRVSPAETLGVARDGMGGRRTEARARRLLVGAQVALALVLLVCAALVGRSLTHLTALDLGVSAPERIAFLELVPSSSDPGPQSAESERAELARWLDQQRAILDRVRATPGVVAVAPVVHEAYAGAAGWDARIEAEGAAPEDSARRPYLNMEITNADYLRVMGVPLLRGRWLAETDREDSPRVVVLSERAARALFPGVDAVGRRVKGWGDNVATVVGVVADTRFREFLEPRASVYVPVRQFDGGALYLAVRTEGDMAGVVRATRRAVADVGAPMFVHGHGTMRDRMAEPLARPKLLAVVLGVYASVVVMLAIAGLYATVAGSVASRRREFGVRAALGATPKTLLALVLREGLQVVAVGAAVGLFVWLGVARLVARFLYGVTSADAATLLGVAAALFSVCTLAVLLPARRAAAADPAAGLRAD